MPKDSHRRRGDAIWNPVQKHERINLSDMPYELIQVELKQRPPAQVIPARLDAVKVTPGRYTVLVDNERVRVLRSTVPPKTRAALHAHPAYVSVALTDAHQILADEKGGARDSVRKAGSVAFNLPLKHTEESLMDQKIEFVLIELK